jgi:hypothetical protein
MTAIVTSHIQDAGRIVKSSIAGLELLKSSTAAKRNVNSLDLF